MIVYVAFAAVFGAAAFLFGLSMARRASDDLLDWGILIGLAATGLIILAAGTIPRLLPSSPAAPTTTTTRSITDQ